MLQNKKILFCGSSELSIGVLEFLKSKSIFPHTVITQPARPVGRRKVLTDTIVNNWCEKENNTFSPGCKIQILKPEKLNTEFLDLIKKENFDLCLVASYGKILKKDFLDIFPERVWNVHPSALPLYRGATPLQAQIINDLKEIVVTVIKMDEQMDHGEILSSRKMDFNWEEKTIQELEQEAGFIGGEIFYDNFSKKEQGGTLLLLRQDHDKATFTKILNKEDGDITRDLQDKNLELIWRKFNAYRDWPGVYFFTSYQNQTIRVKITEMSKDKISGEVKIEKLLPESKKEISIHDFKKTYGEILSFRT